MHEIEIGLIYLPDKEWKNSIYLTCVISLLPFYSYINNIGMKNQIISLFAKAWAWLADFAAGHAS